MDFSDNNYFKRQHSFGDAIKHEHKLFSDYQYVSWNKYLRKRFEFLQKQKNSESNIEFLKSFHPKIAVFAGSFNPFHKGHYNVLQKAENIFDKVIIAFGKNPDKSNRLWEVPKTIRNRQIEEYRGLLTDFLLSLEHDVIVIRGLRNSTDFNYEQNQYRYIQELMPKIKIVNIFCDKEFEHISSSGIRTLEKFGKHEKYLLK